MKSFLPLNRGVDMTSRSLAGANGLQSIWKAQPAHWKSIVTTPMQKAAR